jgi:hypothetical protein
MRKNLLRVFFILVAFLAGCSTLLVASCLAQSGHPTITAQEMVLKTFLQGYSKDPRMDEYRTTRYFPAFVDLKDDGTQEVIVYLTNDGWCGSGGCTTLILAPKDSSYRVVTKITITRPPVRVLATKSNGWHDLAVRVQGGGVVSPYEAKLSFNGRTYPRNPSVDPARRLTGEVPGKVAVPLTAFTEGGQPLYP